VLEYEYANALVMYTEKLVYADATGTAANAAAAAKTAMTERK
jgi:hypothetical protein